jgi:hypothetical protein
VCELAFVAYNTFALHPKLADFFWSFVFSDFRVISVVTSVFFIGMLGMLNLRVDKGFRPSLHFVRS